MPKRTYSQQSVGRSQSSQSSDKPYFKKATVRKPVSSEAKIRSIARNELLRTAEKKHYTLYAANQTITSASATFPSSAYITPQLSQGTQDAQRIGNKVKCVGGSVCGFVNLIPYNAVTNPQPPPVWVKIFLCSYKRQQTNSITNTDADSAFFRVNNANLAFQGNMLDMCLPVNDDSWMVHDTRSFKIGATAANTAGSSPISSGTWTDNSDMSQKFQFDLKGILGSLSYNDATVVPTNKNLWLIFQTVNADGNTSSLNSCEYHYVVDFKFVDL